MSASWPTSVSTDSTLYVAVNELQTNLSAGINNAVTTVGLNSTTGFPSVGLVLIDNEVIKYGGISGNNLTSCTRGFDGTTAASHSSAAIVSFAFCAQHHNGLKDEIIALETYLSNNLGTGSQPLATGSRALASSAGGKITESSVTSTELGYVSGVTSAIQTQLTAKAPSASPTFSGTITTPLTASRALVTGASSELAVSATTAAEIAFVNGVTSAIQTQLNAKMTGTLNSSTGGNLAYYSGSTTISGVTGPTVNAAGYVIGTIVQSVLTVTTTQDASSGSNTFTATTATATIVPKATTHKIRITACSTVGGSATAGDVACFTIKRGTTDLSATADGLVQFTTAGVGGQAPCTIVYLDSPASTSSLVYKVFVKNATANRGVAWNNPSQQSTFLVEEIAA